MSFSYAYSQAALRMKPSPIRELFALIQRPGMISFAGGLPDPAIFPVSELAACASVLSEQGKAVLQYGATEGYRPLVDFLAARMTRELGREVAPEQMLIATGSQQLMDMLSRALLDPGDVVIVEAPTYPGAIHTLRNNGARFALVPCDEHGMIVDALPEVIETCRKTTGAVPKLIYTIINFSNPSGACLIESRRTRLAETSQKYGIPVLEDDPYGPLRYRGSAIPSLCSMQPEGIIYASSFSKILAPGVRVAWAVGDKDLIRKMVVLKQGMDLCSSVVAQALVGEYCRRGHLDTHLGRICSHYAAKAAAMSSALHTHLGNTPATWTDPEGGFFFWMHLPGVDTQDMFRRATDNGVAFLPGKAFYPGDDETIGARVDGSEFARLCFTFAQPAEIDEGAKRLAASLA